MLVLQGERDYQVTMEEFSRWKSALADRTDVSFHSYATLNHLFVAGTGKSVPAEYNTPGHVERGRRTGHRDVDHGPRPATPAGLTAAEG